MSVTGRTVGEQGTPPAVAKLDESHPPPPASTPAPALARGPHRAGACWFALVVLVWAFDWNWCRPWIRHYVMSHSGRSFEFDDLQVHWRHGFDPTIELRGLTIQNAPWAASRQPFIHAGRIAATLSWRSLGSDMTVVNLVELDDAQVDMERQADGLRNWRLGHPPTTPRPPRVRVLCARRADAASCTRSTAASTWRWMRSTKATRRRNAGTLRGPSRPALDEAAWSFEGYPQTSTGLRRARRQCVQRSC